uniref:HPr kinase/phosphorylase n=1 Tax=Pararhizobium sp. IMCC3301 TaxID=3067904 RepID=UPI0027423306|nr:HPr kinase/phosphorylase [Pararhizobium sp. IMCC3301]
MSDQTGVVPTIHGSCVVWRNAGVLIIGRSGSGKSQLALALMADAAAPGSLVADDRVVLQARQGLLVASAPLALRGKIERFGMGIETHETLDSAPLDLVVQLTPVGEMERMPEPHMLVWEHHGIALAKLILPEQPCHGVSAIFATLNRKPVLATQENRRKR